MAIHALAGAALDRLEMGKLGLPKAQNVGRQAAELGDLSDAKIKLIRDDHVGGPEVGAGGLVAGSRRGSGSGRHRVEVVSHFLARVSASNNPIVTGGTLVGVGAGDG
jgi:hypothetical protein